MRNIVLSLVTIISLIGAQAGQSHFMLKDEAFSFLTPTAKEAITKVLKKKHELKKKAREICGIPSAITPQMKEQFKKIREDAKLTKEAKMAEIKKLKEPLKAAMEKNREAMKACKETKKNELAPIMKEKMAIREACFVKLTPAQEQDHKEYRMLKLVKSLTNEQKAELNAKLSSKGCADVSK